MQVDINCDLGESFGVYRLGNDAALMPYITSANIACGLHAGDPAVMRETVRLAGQHGVGVGAHPGYPDLQGFGRRAMELSPGEVEALVLYQLGALAGFCQAEGVTLRHVKPHGALYNQAARDRQLADAIARGVHSFSPKLVLVGLAGSQLVAAGMAAGLRVAAEGFADRAYNPDGTLRSRRLPGAVLEPAEAVAQALRLAQHGVTIETGHGQVQAPVDTLCIHGDSPGAVEIARAVRQALLQAGIPLQPL